MYCGVRVAEAGTSVNRFRCGADFGDVSQVPRSRWPENVRSGVVTAKCGCCGHNGGRNGGRCRDTQFIAACIVDPTIPCWKSSRPGSALKSRQQASRYRCILSPSPVYMSTSRLVEPFYSASNSSAGAFHLTYSPLTEMNLR